MSKLKFNLTSIFLVFSAVVLSAQTAEEILNKYIHLSGGEKQWEKVTNMKITGTAKLISQKMELPFERILDQTGRQITQLTVNGMNYVSIACDGEQVWGFNEQMMPVLKDNDETENTKRQVNDFPFPGFKWKERGYKAKLLESSRVNDIETYKIQLNKNTQLINGREAENVVYLYFDKQNYLPVLAQSPVVSGPHTGKMMNSYLKNYQKIGGYLYPYIVEMTYNDDPPFQILETHQVEWNVDLKASEFKMPEQ